MCLAIELFIVMDVVHSNSMVNIRIGMIKMIPQSKLEIKINCCVSYNNIQLWYKGIIETTKHIKQYITQTDYPSLFFV